MCSNAFTSTKRPLIEGVGVFCVSKNWNAQNRAWVSSILSIQTVYILITTCQQISLQKQYLFFKLC